MTFKAYDIDYGSSQNLAQFLQYSRMLLGIYLNPNIAMPDVTVSIGTIWIFALFYRYSFRQ